MVLKKEISQDSKETKNDKVLQEKNCLASLWKTVRNQSRKILAHMRLRKRFSQLGIEINSDEIRAVKLVFSGNKLYIQNQEIIPLGINKELGLPEALNKLYKKFDYRKERTIISIDHRKTFNQSIHLNSQLKDSKKQQYILTQLQSLFSFPPDKIYYDYYYSATKEPSICHIIAAKKSDFNEIKSAIKKAQLKLFALDINSFACTRLPYFLKKSGSTIAFVLSENKSLSLFVVNQNQLIYSYYLEATDTLSGINRAVQLYQQSNLLPQIDHLFLLGTKSKDIEIDIPQFNKNVISKNVLDPRLWIAFAAATWGYSI